MPFNTPILLTWIRVLLIPVFVAIYYVPDGMASILLKNIMAASVFCVAAITDWLDGYLARKWNQTSAFGAFLDPVADKVMVAAALILLVKLQRTDALLAVIIIGREITISALREWMAQAGARQSVAVSYIGKVKTAAQMVAIILLLAAGNMGGEFFAWVYTLGGIAMAVAAGLTLWSMAYYLHKALPFLKENKNA